MNPGGREDIFHFPSQQRLQHRKAVSRHHSLLLRLLHVVVVSPGRKCQLRFPVDLTDSEGNATGLNVMVFTTSGVISTMSFAALLTRAQGLFFVNIAVHVEGEITVSCAGSILFEEFQRSMNILRSSCMAMSMPKV